jgi:hypothetical protein
VRALEKQIASLKTRVAEEAARADDRVETIVSSEAKKLKDLNERHSRLRREHAALQAAVGRAGGGARGASDLETALTSERDDRFTAQLELVERNVRLEGRRAYEALERAKETQISQMREQSATFLADARAELAAARAEWEKEKKHNVKTNTALAEENDALRTWARSMNGVLRKIEEGAYPVVERGFWRSLRVPPAETRFSKTVPSEERTRAITLAATNTSTFLETMEDDAMATSGTAEFRVENSETRGGGGDAFGNSQTVSGAVPVAFGVSTTRPVDPYDTVAYDRSDRNARAGETFELEAFRKHGDLVEEERAATQEATLRELSSHPTVEYIRALEEENAKVKGDLSRERRSASDARVALQSARRQQDKLITKETLRRQNRASSARPAERVTQSAFGATVPKQTFVGPPMSPESFRATLNPNNGGTHVIRTYAGLTQTNDASRRPNKGLTSPEVAERVRVTTLSRDAARRAEARRARGGVDRNATGASVGYLANQSRFNSSHTTTDGTALEDRGHMLHNPESIKQRNSNGSTSPRPPFGTAGGRRLTDAVPVAGRPLSGSAEVGYGFVLGDGPDAAGGAVGWPAGADRAKSLADRPATGPGGVRSGGAKRAGGAAPAP